MCDICTIDLGSNASTSIEQEVEIVGSQLRPYFASVDHIILIGVSKGGCTAVQYGLKYPAKIKRIITISSPLNGTKVANYHLLCDVTRKELGYNSTLAFNYQQLTYSPDIYSIVPTYDHIIIPASAAAYPQSKQYIYKGFYSHVGILYAPEVLHQIIEWI